MCTTSTCRELEPDPALNSAIARLPGRRFVFTNGCRNHAQRVLDRHRARASSMDDIWDIRTIAFQPKPERAAYERVLAQARHCCRAAPRCSTTSRAIWCRRTSSA